MTKNKFLIHGGDPATEQRRGAGSARVDFTLDGFVDFSDYLEFLNLYDAGC